MNHPIQPHRMLSQPTPNSHFTSPEPSSNFNIIYSFTQPKMCNCQNQLGHWDCHRIPYKDLPEFCKQYMGINIDNAPTSQKKNDISK